MQPRQNIYIDPTNLENPDHKKLLLALLKAKHDNIIINSNTIFDIDGHKVVLTKSLFRRSSLREGDHSRSMKFDVLGPELGKGAFGAVYPVEAVLAFGEKTLTIKPDNNHVIKLSKLEDLSLSPKLIDQTRKERDFMIQSGRSNPKEWQRVNVDDETEMYFLNMKKFKGRTLDSIINRANINESELTVQQRLQLSLALLRALLGQVKEKGLIHRDIKPENIIIDLDTMDINIIDFGLSIKRGQQDGKACGTPQYAAPEIYNREVYDATDLFSMGRVLADLWGNNDLNYFATEWAALTFLRQSNFNYEYSLLREPNRKYYEDGIKNKNTLTQIIEQLYRMTNKLWSSRGSLEDSFKLFYFIYLREKYFDLYKDEEYSQFWDIFENGRELRNTLAASKDAGEFFSQLSASLDKYNNGHEVEEFVHGLGWHCVSGINSKEALLTRAAEITSAYEGNYKKYMSILEKAQNMKEIISKLSVIEVVDLYAFITELNHKLNKIIERPFDLDLLNQANVNLEKNYAFWNQRLEDIKAPYQKIYETADLLQPDEMNEGNRELLDLKNKLRDAITQYLHSTLTDETLAKEERAASSRRAKDVNEFAQIINVSESEEDLIKNTKQRIRGMEGGFFGRSQLKSNIEAVINQHDKLKKRK